MLLERQGASLRIEVCDDGIGFHAASRQDGIGVAGMRERVHALDGSFTIASNGDGGGTRIAIALPLAG